MYFMDELDEEDYEIAIKVSHRHLHLMATSGTCIGTDLVYEQFS